MKKGIIFALVATTLFSCSKEENTIVPEKNQTEISSQPACSFELPSENINGKGGLYDPTWYKWDNKSVIKIKFLGNNSVNTALKVRIKRYARLWLRHVNVNFEWVPTSADADIKIIAGSEGATGNWSKFGTYCLNVPQNEASMSINDVINNDEAWLRCSVIHEFGHALGMIHEHKSPNCDKSSWNTEGIISRYITQQGWTRQYVIEQIFNNYDPSIIDCGTYDRNSIMHYPFSAAEMNTSLPILNVDLSAGDKSFMSSRYPLGNTESIYRFNANNVHTYNKNAYSFAELNTEGVLGRISKTQIANTFPLYRFKTNSGDTYFTFQTTMPQYPQYIYQELVGYASKTPQAGMVPVHQYWGYNHHFYTANYAELGAGGSGYTKEATIFYLFP